MARMEFGLLMVVSSFSRFQDERKTGQKQRERMVKPGVSGTGKRKG